jgi:hypothetical protein
MRHHQGRTVLIEVTDQIAKPKFLGRVIDALELATCHRSTLPGGKEAMSRLDGLECAADVVGIAGGETVAVLYIHYESGGVDWVADLAGEGLPGTRQDPALELATVCARGFGVPLHDYRIG